MNAPSIATAILAATAALTTAQTQGQVPPQTSKEDVASSLQPSRATDAVPIEIFAVSAADPGSAACAHKREALKAPMTPTAFASAAAQGGMIEVALGGLALQKSNNSEVRQFALKMVQEHGRANQELESLVKREGLILPTKLDAKYDAVVSSLNAKSGAAFDRAYIEHMTKDHAEAVALFESASRSSDPALAAFARKTLSTIEEHRQLADRLHASIGIQTASAR